MTFADFQTVNKERCESVAGFNHPVDTTNEIWPWHRWALCIAGESGELCSLVKKILRGDYTLAEKRQEILQEIADIITYCDLMNSALGAETDEELFKKFLIVSERIGWVQK